MARRVSMKGKGADLFFGDDAPKPQESPLEQPPPADSTPSNDAPQAPVPASMPAVRHARKQESKKAVLPDSKPARMQRDEAAAQSSAPSVTDDALHAIWNDVASQASITNSFRYTTYELTRLGDILYEVSKRHGVKLTKQDVARLGLNLVLWDFETHGVECLLSQFAVRRKRQREGQL